MISFTKNEGFEMNEITTSQVESKVFTVRGVQVILDSDIAEFYGVSTSYLNRQVKRNIERFDEEDFMFQLTKDELENLMCQNGTSRWGGKRKLPFAFTEQGIYMLSSVVKSNISISVSKQIMRTFTQMREFALNYKDIVIELQNIKDELKFTKENSIQNSEHIKTAFNILEQILNDTDKTDKNLIGFRPK